MKKIKVGITGTGSLFGQAIVKSIRNSNLSKDIAMVGFDYFENTVGSHWVDKNIALPDLLRDGTSEEMWLKKIVESLQSENIRFLFVGVDFELKLFSQHKKDIESQTQCKIIVSDPDVIRIADDKYLTYQFLKENGFYYPKTALPGEDYKSIIDFPCIVKPRYGARSRGVFMVRDDDELRERISRLNSPLIQELIGSPDEEYTCGVIYLDDSLKRMIALRRVLKDGNTVIARFSKDTPEVIYDYVYKITSKLKPFGACNFQLRLDKNRVPKLFEINARHSGTTYIRSLFGFNEVECILRYLLGWKTEKFSLREGIVKRYYDEMFISTE